jgi:hypothetical protein
MGTVVTVGGRAVAAGAVGTTGDVEIAVGLVVVPALQALSEKNIARIKKRFRVNIGPIIPCPFGRN